MRSIAMAAIALMCGTSVLAQTNETPPATDPAATATTPPTDSPATSASPPASTDTGAPMGTPPSSAPMASQSPSAGTVDIAASDKDKDGALSPLEFAEHMTTMSGDTSMSSKAERDRRGRGSGNSAVKLLNATAADFSKADKNMDRRVDSSELAMLQSGGMSASASTPSSVPSSAPITSGAGTASPAPSTSDTTTTPPSPESATPTEPPSPETKDDMQNSTDPKESTTTPPQSR
jgi:hypothetical protein